MLAVWAVSSTFSENAALREVPSRSEDDFRV